MQRAKYVICGAGPAGLTFASMLQMSGENDFIVIEKEADAGGLCRSVNVDGAPLDIGGGHFLDVHRKSVTNFLFRFLPEDEWKLFERNSVIHYCGMLIQHPFEANIWQMDTESQVDFLETIAKAGCVQGTLAPNRFSDWIVWKFGKKIADEYMLPYNRKMFGNSLDILGTYWLEKLPNVSFQDTLRSCLEKKAYGTEPGHSQFYYPKKYGYGEVWHRMSNFLDSHIHYNACICKLDIHNHIISCNNGETYQAEIIITTVPWSSMQIVGLPNVIENKMALLKYTSVEIEYCPKHIDTDAYWIYEPDLEISYHRILARENFCSGSRGYWTETNADRLGFPTETGNFRYMNEYAYPLNTIGKQEIMQCLLAEMQKHNIYGLGRWGEHQHYNSDVVVERGMHLAQKLLNTD